MRGGVSPRQHLFCPRLLQGRPVLGSGNEGREAGGRAQRRSRGPPCCLKLPQRPLLPVDEVLILIALHLILNGGLQVPDALECQF